VRVGIWTLPIAASAMPSWGIQKIGIECAFPPEAPA
jgi:hypothetical protein